MTSLAQLDELSDALEAATDVYEEACGAAAKAENAAERAEMTALVRLRNAGEPVTVVGKLAKAEALDELAVARIKTASEKAALRRVKTLESQLSAAQSHNRMVRGQT